MSDRKIVTNDEVVRAWEGANSPKDAAEKLGMDLNALNARVRVLRTKFLIPLKTFRRGRVPGKVDANELLNLLKQIRHDESLTFLPPKEEKPEAETATVIAS